MNGKNREISPHEPDEVLVSSVEEVFREAEESQRRWQEWEQQHPLKSAHIGVLEAENPESRDQAQRPEKSL